MASAANTVIPIIRATLPRDRASGERPTFGAALLPGWERIATGCLLQGSCVPCLMGKTATAKCLTHQPPQAAGSQWRDRAGFTPASFSRHAPRTLRGRCNPVNPAAPGGEHGLTARPGSRPETAGLVRL